VRYMLTVTDVAAGKIREVLEEEGQKDTPLRIIAIPNGNGSVQYMLNLEEEDQADDVSIELDGLKFLVDSDSAPYVEQATVDFVEDMTRVGFIISNPEYPAASGGCGSGCGCGAGSAPEGATEASTGGCGCGAGGCGSH